MKKILLLTIVTILLSSGIFAYNSTNFNDGINLYLPFKGNIYNYGAYNTPFSWCEQEFANVSTACGGLSTGDYSVGGNWSNGVWTDYDCSVADKYVNYTILDIINTAVINWSYSSYTQCAGLGGSVLSRNITVPSSCLNEDKLQLRFNTTHFGYSNQLYLKCWNTTDWEWFDIVTNIDWSPIVTEEKVYWNKSITDIITSYYINDTLVCNSTSSSICGNFTDDKLDETNSSLYLSGDDYIVTDLNFSSKIDTNEISFSSWVKVSDSITQQTLISSLEALTYHGIEFYITNNDNLGVYLINNWGDDEKIDMKFNYNITDNLWHHILFTYNGNSSASGIKLYIDNIEITNTTITTDSLTLNPYNSTSNFWIGARPNSPILYNLYGSIDEIRLYNRTLEEYEIKNLYNAFNRFNYSFSSNISNYDEINRNFTVLLEYENMNNSDVTCGVVLDTDTITCTNQTSTGPDNSVIVPCIISNGIPYNIEFQPFCSYNPYFITEVYDMSVLGYNYTWEHEDYVLTNHTTYEVLNITVNPLLWKSVSEVKFEYNGVNYSPSPEIDTPFNKYYNYSFIPNTVSGDHEVRNAKWWLTLTNYSDDEFYFNTSLFTQDEYNVQMGECTGYVDEVVANISYFDELTDESIPVNFTYNSDFYDGELTSSFTYTGEGNYTELCTNLHDTIFNYSWELQGDINLESESNNISYVPRVYSFSEGGGLSLNNNVPPDHNLYLIPTENSSTVTYTWLTYQSQTVNGDLKIYRCNNDGTKDLIESVPIVSGNAVANIELFTQLYSYEVVVDGKTYTESDGFTRCHTESATEVSYYIDLIEDDMIPVVGLWLVNCDLDKVSEDTVSMSFSTNNANLSPIMGCIVAYRQGIYNITEIYRNCTNSTYGEIGQITRTIDGSGFSYYVQGEIYQSGNKALCKDTISFFTDGNQRDILKVEGLFAIILLIMALALLWKGGGMSQIFGAVIGLISVFILGIFVVDWITIITIIILLISIAIVGRNKQ